MSVKLPWSGLYAKYCWMIYFLDYIESFRCKFPNLECGGPPRQHQSEEERNDGQKSPKIIIIHSLAVREESETTRPVFLASLQGFCSGLVWPTAHWNCLTQMKKVWPLLGLMMVIIKHPSLLYCTRRTGGDVWTKAVRRCKIVKYNN